MSAVNGGVDTVIDHPWICSDVDHQDPRSGEFLHGQIACYTHRSPEKDQNEDALAIVPVSEHSGIMVVADGLGGQPRGDLAAHTIVEAFSGIASTQTETLREAILHAIDQANKHIIESGTGGGATLAVLEIEGRYVRPYHVGDAFVIVMGQRGKIKFQNIAHSPVGYAVESGLMDEDDAVHHHERNLVSNIVGTPEMYIDIGPRIELALRDTVVIASDGLSDNLYVEEIVETARLGPLGNAVMKLKQKARNRMSSPEAELPSHPDDLSICLFRLDMKHAARQLKMTF